MIFESIWTASEQAANSELLSEMKQRDPRPIIIQFKL